MKSLVNFIVNEAAKREPCKNLNDPKEGQRVFISTSKTGEYWSDPKSAFISRVEKRSNNEIKVEVYPDRSKTDYIYYIYPNEDTGERLVVISDPKLDVHLSGYRWGNLEGYIICTDKDLIDKATKETKLRLIIQKISELKEEIEDLEQDKRELELELSEK